MRWGVALACGIVGCGLSSTGTGSAVDPDAGAFDAGVFDATIASSVEDASVDADAAPLRPCGADAAAIGANGHMCAPFASTAPKVDGDLVDWNDVSFFHLDAKSGFVSKTVTISCDFALQWTADTIYFAAHVTDPKPQGSNTTDPYENSSIELYLDGDGMPRGNYQADDHQWVVDYKNLAKQYDSGNAKTPVIGFASAAVAVTGGYVVEMKVPASALGHATLDPATLGLDVELNEDGTGPQSGVLIYYRKAMPTTCGGCDCTNDQPSCNTYVFGDLALER